MDFVEEDLAPEDQVAVMAYNRSTRFTTDREPIIKVLKSYQEHHEEIP